VNVSPFAVVTVSESGIGPRFTLPAGVAQYGGGGVHQHPDPEERGGGGEEQQRQRCDGGFAEHDASPSAQRVVELGEPQQMTGRVGRGADDEHGERDRMLAGDRLAVPDPGTVAGALDRDGRRSGRELPRLGLR
jgi:hypothetical protein